MCTVTFIPQDVGYYLAMNRDEQLTRVAGLPPERRFVEGRSVLYPPEPGGGTWISLNDARVCFALINWYSVPARVVAGAVSRGEVVKVASSSGRSDEADEKITNLRLNFIKPFRLIGIFPGGREVVEWRWDSKTLVRHNREWELQQWISSGHDEPKAQNIRSATFERMRRDGSAGKLDWLRRLHSSHSPERGPFSMCMHRDGAGTVSYTEIVADSGCLKMSYQPGFPCELSPMISLSLLEMEFIS
jgi:hypothetical protein